MAGKLDRDVMMIMLASHGGKVGEVGGDISDFQRCGSEDRVEGGKGDDSVFVVRLQHYWFLPRVAFSKHRPVMLFYPPLILNLHAP